MEQNKIGHVEWASTDLDRTKDFLSGLFNWNFKTWSEEYYLFSVADGPGGGIMRVDKVDPGNSPVVYVEVDDIESTLGRVEELGGGIAQPKTEIPDMGWYAHFTDPDGNVIGLYQGK
jgi:predicted enzyme related to lactoylglutathione lyase